MFFHQVREEVFGFFEFTCSSALANASTFDNFVDVPALALLTSPDVFLRPWFFSYRGCGTPVALNIVIDPVINF